MANDWDRKIQEVLVAHRQLQDNMLFRRMMEHCRITANDLRVQAGAVATDRDMNRLHGRASALDEMVLLAPKVADELTTLYAINKAREDMEDGATPDSNRDQRQADTGPGRTPAADKRRVIFTELQDEGGGDGKRHKVRGRRAPGND